MNIVSIEGLDVAEIGTERSRCLQIEFVNNMGLRRHMTHRLGTVGDLEQFLMQFTPKELKNLKLRVDTFLKEHNVNELEAWKIMACDTLKCVISEVLEKIQHIVKLPKN